MNFLSNPAGGELRYDLVVVGGGTAGSAAAIAAARRGLRVLILEEANCLGGTSTAGGVNEWYASLDGLGSIFDEIKDGMAACGAKFGRFYNSEYLKICWQLLAEKAGVDVVFHAQVFGVEAGEGAVRTVRFAACSRTYDVQARFFLDATGEGDLSQLAGAACWKGDAQGRDLMHVTLTFILHNTGRLVEAGLPAGLARIETEADLPGLRSCFRLPDDRIYCNMTKVIGVDTTDPFALSRAEREARRQVIQIVDFLQRTRFPTYSLCHTGARIGIREGRRVVCDYNLTEQDIVDGAERRPCPDAIAVATCHIDLLDPKAQGGGGRREPIRPYPIPLRSLLVKSFRNLLVAGKCIGGDQVAMASYRMIPTCCAMGQAAGTVTALALAAGKSDPRDVPVAELQAALRADGVELDPAKHKSFRGWSAADKPNRNWTDDA